MSTPMTPNSPILGPTDPTATVAAAWAYVESRSDRGPIVNPDEAHAYTRELHRLCQLAGIRFEAAFPQACDECDVFRDETYWGAYGNPVGFGAEETLDRPGDINYTGGSWTPVGAARVHLVHLWLYAGGTTLPESLAPFKELDTRWEKAISAGYAGKAPTLAGLAGRWAVNPNYARQIAAHANRAFPNLGTTPTPPKETPPMPKPKILLTRGHGTTGDTGAIVGAHAEETYNKRIVPAIAKALRAAGYDVTTFPNPPEDEAPGTLDHEGTYARNWIARTPGEVVMLDCHLESSSARGIFAIVANDVGLHTAAAGAQPATDTYANNGGDRALGTAICAEISRLTGVPIRTGWVREPGLMSEDMTYVGGRGWRLAMFGYTAEFHQRAYRLIIEFANLQHDAAFYTRADFPERCGQGMVRAMNRIFGVADTPETPAYSKPKPIAALARLDAGDRAGLDAVTLKEGDRFEVFRREVEAIRKTPRYQVANARSTARVGPDIERGERFVPAWKFVAGDGAEWFLSAAWTRVRGEDVAVVDETPAQAA